MRGETLHFFAEVLHRDLSALEFLDSRFAMLDDWLQFQGGRRLYRLLNAISPTGTVDETPLFPDEPPPPEPTPYSHTVRRVPARVSLPPLRERGDDISLLAAWFLDRCRAAGPGR